VVPSDDLAGRVARLERLLDSFERSRAAADRAPAPDIPDAVTRLQELIAIVGQRVASPDLDDGDRIAMRALLEEFRSITSELRHGAAEALDRIDRLGTELDTARGALQRLEEPR
jgi:hypothetical protein